jgi:hypothetical protein
MLKFKRRVDVRLAVGYDTDIARCPAYITTHQFIITDELAKVRTGHCSGCRAGKDDPEWLLHRHIQGNQLRGAVGEVDLALKIGRT